MKETILNYPLVVFLFVVIVGSYIADIISLIKKRKDYYDLGIFRKKFITQHKTLFKKGIVVEELHEDLLLSIYKLSSKFGNIITLKYFHSKVTNEVIHDYRLLENVVPKYRTTDLEDIIQKIELNHLSLYLIDLLQIVKGKCLNEITILSHSLVNPVIILCKPAILMLRLINAVFFSDFVERKIHPLATLISLPAYILMLVHYWPK